MNASSNIADLNLWLIEYQRLSGKSTVEVLQKQAGELGRNLYAALRVIIPPKGSIRDTIMARLKSGKMIRIRQSVRDSVTAKRSKPTKSGKQRTFSVTLQQALVAREISVRESGRGVLSISARYKNGISPEYQSVALSRYGTIMSEAGIKTSETGGVAQFLWSGASQQSARVIKGLHGPKGEAAVKDAIQATIKNIRVYTERKQKELITAALKKLVK